MWRLHSADKRGVEIERGGGKERRKFLPFFSARR